jgi:hypothetical protein
MIFGFEKKSPCDAGHHRAFLKRDTTAGNRH